MKYTIVACLAAILCLLGAIPLTPSSAQDVPPLPHAFYGSVTINGTPAANGTVVEARGENVLTGIAGNPLTVTEAGKYGGPGGFDPKLVVQGNITDGTNLTFYVNNVTAQCYDVQAGGAWLDSYPFDAGEVTELDLKVGVAPEPDISVIPTAKDFGNIPVGSSSSPQTFNVSNVGYANLVVGTINITGVNAAQFTIQNDNVSNQTIIPNGSATLQVVFTPASTGVKSATLNIPSNDPAEPTVLVSLSGTGVPAEPDISVSPTEKDFGNITVNSSLPQTFTVSNVGNADLVVGALNITGPNADQFTIQNDNVSNQTVIPNGSATLQVVFTPTSTGAKSATLNIPSNDPAEPIVLVSLSGTGVTGEPDISVSPTEKNFGSITVGSSSSPQTFNVSNVGDADLVVWTINITGTNADQFTIHNDNASNQTIIANGSATLQVVFNPTSTGAKSATLNIPSNDPDEATVSVSLNGTGITGPGPPGPGPGPGAYYLTVNMLGDISKWNISEQGNLLEPLQVSSADNKVTIALGKDASCLDKGNNRLSTITISKQTGWPSLPEDYSIIGPAYEFRPAGAKFAPSLSLTLGYADNDVPQYVSEEDIYIAYYDATAANWVPLTSQVNTQNNRVAAPVRHFTTFAIIGIAVPPTPAEFSVTSLDLSSEQVEPGQEVLVTVNVTNIGGSEGSYTLDLTINGEVEQTKTVTLASLASDTVTFIVIKEELGTYTVSVDGLTKEFIVGAPSWVSQYWWIVLAAIVIIGVVVSFLWARRRRARA